MSGRYTLETCSYCGISGWRDADESFLADLANEPHGDLDCWHLKDSRERESWIMSLKNLVTGKHYVAQGRYMVPFSMRRFDLANKDLEVFGGS